VAWSIEMKIKININRLKCCFSKTRKANKMLKQEISQGQELFKISRKFKISYNQRKLQKDNHLMKVSESFLRKMNHLMISSRVLKQRMNRGGQILLILLKKSKKINFLKSPLRCVKMKWLCLKNSEEERILKITGQRLRNINKSRQ